MSGATLTQTAQKNNLHPWLTLEPTEATAEIEDALSLDFLIWESIFGGAYPTTFRREAANDEAIPFDVSFLTREGRAYD